MTSSRDPNTLKVLGQLSTLGLAFVFALVMGFAAGNWLDRRFDTSPWLSLTGFAVGLAAGVLNVVRTMRVVNAAPRPPDGRDDGGGPGRR
ncbi:MAG: AtpZ/AtpI family protein [Vicinamibacterales bacterium]